MEQIVDDISVPTDSVWVWSENDPFAVKLALGRADTFINWAFAVELILEAFRTGVVAGLGQVKVWHKKDDHSFHIALESWDEQPNATFRCKDFSVIKWINQIPPLPNDLAIKDVDIWSWLDNG